MKYLFLVAVLIYSLLSCAQTSTINESKNTLAKLQPGESITIQYLSEGCFGGSQYKLIIIKQGKGYQAELYYIPETYDRKANKIIYHPDSLVNTAILTEQNLDDFARFEQEPTYEREANCTLIDTYIIKSKYLNTQKTDGSCKWNGFNNLTKNFFGSNQ